MSNNLNYQVCTKQPARRYNQPYKGIYLWFRNVPDPEDVKYAQDSFDETYPTCEECEKTVYLCTCMLELEGFAYE